MSKKDMIELVLCGEIFVRNLYKRGTQRLLDHMPITSFPPLSSFYHNLFFSYMQWTFQKRLKEECPVSNRWSIAAIDHWLRGSSSIITRLNPLMSPPPSSPSISCICTWRPTLFHLQCHLASGKIFGGGIPNNAWNENANLLDLVEFCGEIIWQLIVV